MSWHALQSALTVLIFGAVGYWLFRTQEQAWSIHTTFDIPWVGFSTVIRVSRAACRSHGCDASSPISGAVSVADAKSISVKSASYVTQYQLYNTKTSHKFMESWIVPYELSNGADSQASRPTRCCQNCPDNPNEAVRRKSPNFQMCCFNNVRALLKAEGRAACITVAPRISENPDQRCYVNIWFILGVLPSMLCNTVS